MLYSKIYMIELRQYQQNAINAVYRYWLTNKGKNPTIVAPTGSGKSLIISEFIRQTINRYPNTRIMVVTDSRELVDQNAAELKKLYPTADVGIYSAGLGRKDTNCKITFAGIQSVYRHMYEFYPSISVVIVDEAHCIPRSSDTRYGEFVKAIKECNPKAVFLGLTATNYRMDSGFLHEGKDRLFDGIAYEIKITELIKDGYLVPVISKGGLSKIDVSNVHSRGGDFIPEELATAADSPELIKGAVDEIIKYGEDRKAWLIFATSVQHAIHIKEEMILRGVDCEVVTGETPKKQRDDIILRFKNGNLKALININLLIKGFNNPRIDLVALMTATQSTAKYVQAVGRILRTYPGKENGLLLDFSENVITHGQIDNIRPIKRGGGSNEEDTPVKQCPKCKAFLPIQTRECECGYQYPERERILNHNKTAYSGAVLTDQILPTWINIRSVSYHRHEKSGSKDSLKIVYYSSVGKQYPVWCSLDHPTSAFAVNKARQWIKNAGATEFTVSGALCEALSDLWKRPSRILIKPDGKFWQVLSADYSEPISEQAKIGGV